MNIQVDMDAIKIGPAGQTLGEMKAEVIRSRQALRAALLAGTGISTPLVDASQDATRMLRAAYTRLGLPYESPKG